MLRLASEKDRREVLDYCLEEPNINLFIIGDIEN
ncbi:GNAT family N-acetyltransferase, partial [Clostridium saudiense]|nr:GNAT family N-acetyltransferase [Clostridium saudiense]